MVKKLENQLEEIDEYEFITQLKSTASDYLALYQQACSVLEEVQLAKEYEKPIVYFRKKDECGDYEYGWYTTDISLIGFKNEP
jgi:hypothetical protein